MFEESITEIPNIVQAQRVFGDPDYRLRTITRDLATFQRLYDEQLAALPGVQRLTSTLVMKSVAEGRPLPLQITEVGARRPACPEDQLRRGPRPTDWPRFEPLLVLFR
jgi:DNA-binding Lrp family transcriptional regulator